MSLPPPWAYMYTASAFLISSGLVVGITYVVLSLVSSFWASWPAGSLYKILWSRDWAVPTQIRVRASRRERYSLPVYYAKGFRDRSKDGKSNSFYCGFGRFGRAPHVLPPYWRHFEETLIQVILTETLNRKISWLGGIALYIVVCQSSPCINLQ